MGFHQANPDPDDFVQRQHILYHQLIVDYAAARILFADSFRTYINDRRYAAVERLIATAKEVRPFLVALQAPYLAEFDGWLSLRHPAFPSVPGVNGNRPERNWGNSWPIRQSPETLFLLYSGPMAKG
ncbi:MAG: hypothetical protein IPL78_19965 [Chloroflexi bacterium]|nr:hypothetical protein [Chloroflexota bacterium]